MNRISTLFLFVLLTGCAWVPAESTEEPSVATSTQLTLELTQCVEGLERTLKEREDWIKEAERSWKIARKLLQEPNRIPNHKMAALHQLIKRDHEGARDWQPRPKELWLYAHAPTGEDAYLVLISHSKRSTGEPINHDRCVFKDGDGLVDQAHHMDDWHGFMHPNGPQTFNANTMTGLEEAEYWQKECARLVDLALNN